MLMLEALQHCPSATIMARLIGRAMQFDQFGSDADATGETEALVFSNVALERFTFRVSLLVSAAVCFLCAAHFHGRMMLRTLPNVGYLHARARVCVPYIHHTLSHTYTHTWTRVHHALTLLRCCLSTLMLTCSGAQRRKF